MRHENQPGRGGGYWDDDKGAVAAMLAKQRHADLLKEIRATQRSIVRLVERQGWAVGRTLQNVKAKIELKEAHLGNLVAEAQSVERKAIDDFSKNR